MSLWKFQHVEDVRSFLLEEIDTKLMLPTDPEHPNNVVMSHNGDKMTVDLDTNIIKWEPVDPVAVSNSWLSFCFDVWFRKGFIVLLKNEHMLNEPTTSTIADDEKPCVICGKPTKFIDYYMECRFCSKECQGKYYGKLYDKL